MAEVQGQARLSGGRRAAVGVSVALGLGLAGYGVAGSYQTVSDLAERRDIPLASLVPVGIDGGLIGVVVLDLVLSWVGQPIGWLRQFVRVLTVGTVAANAAAGWPDLVSAGLHVAAPLMLLAMVEAGRTVLLRPSTARTDTRPDPAGPVGPGPMADMADVAVHGDVANRQLPGRLEAEQERRHAITLLRDRHGRRWKRQAPQELVWMLRTGVSISDVVVRARGLGARADADAGHAPSGADPATREADMSASTRTATNGHAAGSDGGRLQTRRKPLPGRDIDDRGIRRSATAQADRADPLAKAAQLLADQPDMTGANLGRELGVIPRHGLRLKKQAERRRPND
jgi:Protein of unknown function (DUF2637)